MIQMLAAVVVCAAMTRFVFLGLTEEGEQGPGAHAPTASLAELEGTIELEMAKRPKPDFVVVTQPAGGASCGAAYAMPTAVPIAQPVAQGRPVGY